MATLSLKRFFSIKDWGLAASLCVLCVFGLVGVVSVSYGSASGRPLRHGIYFLIGIGLFLAIGRMERRHIRTLALPFYVGCVALLVGVLFFGTTLRGTRGWFTLGTLTMQPVEFMKVGLVLMSASFFERARFLYSPLSRVMRGSVFLAPPILLTLAQPDVGSALVLCVIGALMVLLCAPRRMAFTFLLLAAVFAVFSWMFLFKDYQKQRVATLLNPRADPFGVGYNIRQSVIAVGAGELFGRGIGEGPQSHLRFLPEATTDFSFAVIAEELGFAGVCVMLIAFGVFFWSIMRIIRTARDEFSIFLALGVGVWLFFQTTVNIGMNIGLLPAVGLPLPFVSYGGSALIASCMGAGLVLAVSKQ